MSGKKVPFSELLFFFALPMMISLGILIFLGFFSTVFLVLSMLFWLTVPPVTILMHMIYGLFSLVAFEIIHYVNGVFSDQEDSNTFSLLLHLWYQVQMAFGTSVIFSVLEPIVVRAFALRSKFSQKRFEPSYRMAWYATGFTGFATAVFIGFLGLVVALHSAAIAIQLPRFIACEAVDSWSFVKTGFSCGGSFMQ